MYSPNNPQTAGANWRIKNQTDFIFGTEYRIDLKPGCKFKFLHCLDTYIEKYVSLDHEGTLEGLFCQWSPEKKIRGVNRLIKEVESEYSVLEDS